VKERVIIVSGFGAFRDYRHDDENPSTPLARQFASEVITRNIHCVCVASVAVNWGAIERVIAEQVAGHQHARVTWVAFGAGRDFAIETCATNRRATEQPDVSGRWPGQDVPLLNDIEADPDATHTIPLSHTRLRDMQQALEARGFSLRLSTDAGGYICNAAAYAIYKMYRKGAVENALFLHTPEALENNQRVAFAAALAELLLDERIHLA
jgi:pyrrolidone-carboxylate peptidase